MQKKEDLSELLLLSVSQAWDFNIATTYRVYEGEISTEQLWH